jgi:hypothetical protein
MTYRARRSALFCLWSVVLAAPARGAEPKPTDAAAEFFEKKIRPVLVEHCYGCHSAKAEKLKGNLLLDSREGLLRGGNRGPAVVPGDPDKSRLIVAVRFKDVDLQMPQRGKLPDAVIADLTTWVAQGAPWFGESAATTTVKKLFDLEQRKRDHWAWKPVRRTEPPAVKHADWPLGPIDRFILAKLEEKGLIPAADADARTLVRRLYFDLIGLPPTPEQIDAFERAAAARPQAAVEALVDELLASPHFGERWGRHWLDLVRYGESRGHEFDYTAPNAYQYRDYVVRALNADVPYNQLVTEHVAGDLLTSPRLHPKDGFNESVLGTGFWFLGEEVHSPVDVRQDQADRYDNRLDVLTKAFLGLTVTCARCHDHKFDAISTRDYYALSGFLQSSNHRLVRFDTLEHNRRVAADLAALRERGRRVIGKAVGESLKPAMSKVSDYLMAAREVIHSGLERKTEDVAAQRKLDPAILTRWVAHLLLAANDPAEPFHLWAKVAADAKSGEAGRVASLVRSFVADGEARDAQAAAALRGAKVVIDYASSKPDEWFPDDASFGPAPVRPGELRLNGDEANPAVRFTDHAAAAFDPVWSGLKPAARAETSPGALASPLHPGRTVSTPTFTLEGGKVFYLVRGEGTAYFAVATHELIAGPLHARLVTPVKAGAEFRWVGQDLTPYRGQRVHVEFTGASSDFAVAMVVQADAAPKEAPPSDAVLRQALAGADSPEALAAAYRRLLHDLADRLAADTLRGSAERARLANWVLARPGLFAADGDAPKAVLDAAAPLVAEQKKIVAGIRNESRLAMAMQDGSGVDEYVFIRGSYRERGEVVPRRFLEALAGPKGISVAHGSGRLELARQMTDPVTNPFVGRVIVNRLWHHLFGRGIVASVDNFGVLGEAPTQPELLDYLADQFVRDGWSMKRMIRALVLSRAYRMSSHADPKADEADPNDLWLHRARVRRLEGEAIRDALLSVSGRLDRTMYGPSVPVYLTPFQDGRGRPASGPLDGAGRRSLYLAVRRNFLSPLLLAFDTPIPFSTVGRRTVSNVPAQALILLNDPFVHQQAEVWARRVLASPGTPRERVTGMYLSAFGRPPSDAELTACLAFLERQSQATGTKADDVRVWADLAHTLVNVKEFIFVN